MLILFPKILLNIYISSSCLFVDSFRFLHRQSRHVQINFYLFLSYVNAFYLFFFKATFLISVFVLLVTCSESKTWLQFPHELTETYNLTHFWVCIHFPLGDTKLSLVPVSCNESAGLLGNWTRSLGEYLDGKQHNRTDGHRSKILFHIILW